MKDKFALIAFLFLLFGCTQQATQPLQEKTLAQELGILLPAPHSAFYSTNISSQAGDFFGTLSTYYSEGNFRADVSFEGLPSYSFYGINGTIYLCTFEGSNGNCTLAGDTSSFGFVLSQPASLFSIEKLPSRTISGMGARCFSISPKNTLSYSASINCYSEKGILLYSFSQEQTSGIITETAAISIGSAPSEAKFRLPYEVK